MNTLVPVTIAVLERQSRDEVIANLGELFETGANSDFVIKVPKSANSSEYSSVKV